MMLNSIRLWHRFSKCRQLIHASNHRIVQRVNDGARPNLNLPHSACGYFSKRKFHFTSSRLTKVYVDNENEYAYSVINTQDNKKTIYKTETIFTDDVSFQKFTSQNWRKKPIDEIVAGFRTTLNYCVLHDISVSDRCFDALTDGLMDNVEHLTDELLIELLDTLAQFPFTDSLKSHNFHDIWSALDDFCCWKLKQWSLETLFDVGDRWYKLNLGKSSQFITQAALRMQDKLKHLTVAQLVHTFFYINLSRKNLIGFDLQEACAKHITEMSVDQMAVVALAFFKTETKIKLPGIMIEMLRAVEQDDNLHDITLTAILKTIRYSAHPQLADPLLSFLDSIAPRLHRHSILANLHAALAGTIMQIAHPPTILTAAERIGTELEKNPEAVRLKDMERILLPITMFNCDVSDEYLKRVVTELKKEERLGEFARYPRCIPCALHFLAIRNIYDHSLMDRVLNTDFIYEVYGKNPYQIPREVLALDVACEAECPDYKLRRLTKAQRTKCTKKLYRHPPTQAYGSHHSTTDRFYFDVHAKLAQIASNNMVELHILPSYERNDIILAKHRKTNECLTVDRAYFDTYNPGDIMYAPRLNDVEYLAVIIAGWNNTIRYTSHLVGYMRFKMRLLEKAGFKPVPVIWNEYITLNDEFKLKYLRNKLGVL